MADKADSDYYDNAANNMESAITKTPPTADPNGGTNAENISPTDSEPSVTRVATQGKEG